MRNETQGIASLACRHCCGAGVLVTRCLPGTDEERGTVWCHHCAGSGRTLCIVCDQRPSTELDVDNNPLCAECAAHERALESMHCDCGHPRVVAISAEDGRPKCDRCLTAPVQLDRHLWHAEDLRAVIGRAS